MEKSQKYFTGTACPVPYGCTIRKKRQNRLIAGKKKV